MTLFLLKSVACLLILLLVHRLFLQREAIYKFNRFFLLAAVLGSFLIPLLQIEVNPEPSPVPQLPSSEIVPVPIMEAEISPEVGWEAGIEEIPAEKSMDWSLVLWTVYGLVSLVLLFRFIRNIHLIVDKINRNVHLQFRGETLVLLNEQRLPFSFLNYIFVAKDYFESDQLTDSIFAHERAHVRGKHSWDNLLIEALLVIFWFHPGLYLARQAIKLNHEFIADEAALQITPLDQYKSFLLAMMLPEKNPGLASSLNFSLTKKRFEMMKRKTANSTKWMKMLSVAPILAGLVYFFSEKVPAQTEGEKNSKEVIDKVELSQEKKEAHILLRADGQLEVDGQLIKLEQLRGLIDSIYNQNTLVRISADQGVEMGQLADVQGILRENDLRKVVYQEQSQQKNEASWPQIQEAYYRNAYILVEDENMVYTHKTYNQLTEQEKKGLFGPMIPRDKEHPDPASFESWKDGKHYKILIDWVVIPNEKLDDYTTTDFVAFFQSNVKPNARSERFPQPYQVNLYTDDYYDKNFGPESPDRQPRTSADTITLTKRMVTWNKDISRYPDPNTAFLQKNARYENLRTSGSIYEHKSPEEKALLESLYQELEREYSSFSDKRKKSLRQPIPPNSTTPRNGKLNGNSTEMKGVRNLTNESDEAVFTLVNSPAMQSKALKEYLSLYGQYQTKAYENRLFSQPVESEIIHQQELFRTLEAKYNGLSFEDRRRVKRVNFPFVKFEKDGKDIFVKIEDLTPQQRAELGC